jgi:hypothetical protein
LISVSVFVFILFAFIFIFIFALLAVYGTSTVHEGAGIRLLSSYTILPAYLATDSTGIIHIILALNDLFIHLLIIYSSSH